MKKRLFLIFMLTLVIFLTGCGKENKEKLRQNFINDTSSLKGYYMEGVLSITNNDDTYNYDVKVGFKKDDNFKVTLLNKANNYEQIILRNTDGVYIVNPSLNRSFKFQSEWPYNNSQSYLLHSVANDLKEDNSYTFEQKDNNYIFTTKVNYPNNPNLVKEKITLDKDLNLKEVKVLSKDNIPYIIFTVSSLDKKAIFADNYFLLETISKNLNEKTTTEEDAKTTLKIDEALFPLYLPSNTSLKNRETIKTDVGERVIMTFAGDNPFILVQETVTREKEFTTIPTSGSPYLLVDTVGALTNGSYTWISTGIEYYIVSDVMEQNELLEVAKSINAVPTINEK